MLSFFFLAAFAVTLAPSLVKAGDPKPSISRAPFSETTWSKRTMTAINRYINPDLYDCEPTYIDEYFEFILSNMDFNVLLQLIDYHREHGILDWPYYYKFFMDFDASDEDFGSVQANQDYKKRFRQLNFFGTSKAMISSCKPGQVPS